MAGRNIHGDVHDWLFSRVGRGSRWSNIAGLPFVHHHVAAMPDMHLGIGATIGSVIATHKAIIPAAVGVDSVAANAGLTQAAGDLCPTSARSESLLTLGC